MGIGIRIDGDEGGETRKEDMISHSPMTTPTLRCSKACPGACMWFLDMCLCLDILMMPNI